MIYSLPRQQKIQLNTNPPTLTLKAKIFIVYRVGMLRILYSFQTSATPIFQKNIIRVFFNQHKLFFG